MTLATTQILPESQPVQPLQHELNLIIRSAQLKDIKIIGELWYYQRCHHEQWDRVYKTTDAGHHYWIKYIRSCLKETNHLVLVAEDKLGTIVGYIHGSFFPWPLSPFNFYGSLNTISVSPEAQNQGIGKKLVKKLIEWFRKQEIQYISVHVDHHNQAALHLYEKSGFRPYQHRLMLSFEA